MTGKLVVLVLVLGMCVAPVAQDMPSPTPAKEYVVSESLVDKMAFLYNQFDDSEFLVCWVGEERDGNMYFDDLRLPRIAYSSPWSVTVVSGEGCETYPKTVAVVHNHIVSQEAIKDGGGDVDQCYLSPVDSKTGQLESRKFGVDYSVVFCGPRMYTIWHVTDIGLWPLVTRFRGRTFGYSEPAPESG